jgi:2-amino-4-hydroxy-6-hydroxymethyldihydropteridine diphosphokinase
MDFERWEPLYLRILADMGYDRQADIDAARLLDSICPRDRICDESCLSNLITDRATIVGNAPVLDEQLTTFKPIGTIIAADGATTHLLDAGFIPSVIVTDLDGEVIKEAKCNADGSVAVIHAHGDNIGSIKESLSLFRGSITPTVQCRPFGCLRNFGGFTDGDRAVLLAAHFGSKRIRLVGFDFDNPGEKKDRDQSVKLRKLVWARKIIDGMRGEIVIV